ncbi:hypothetical protein [Dickeya solani]|uniref:Uncharacterized protein n=1 Tax=Dickeya solani D s0432-1 TaxID=1231725 RepID=A0AAV3K7X5_9GAMM|nr:hypothetical protein [Dickeya solani]ANE74762.1 hypothetical protein A4U42_05140 [Dickeya solani IPO 2222]AUC42064.1 hypothetical protein D083_1715 [Dickeya solani RNS 08.23.3.1.A]AUH09824.1 hypothetical protein BJD21_15900 [Dickeya solani D s0432-1]AUH13782.1 hypothetical protein BJJ98_15870 [Dickeya solani]AYQ49268.1 hypothetical protein CTB91_03514 [Dickeya solani]
MSDYGLLFQLRIEHEFFAGCASLPFYGELAPHSQPAATRAGLLIKPLVDGLMVLADRSQNTLLMAEALSLRWWFYSREPGFLCYTAIPELTERDTPYFRYTLSGSEPGEVRLEAANGTAPEESLSLRARPVGLVWLVDIDISAAAIAAFASRQAAPLLIVPFLSQRRRWKYLFTAPYVNTQSRIQDSRQDNQFDYLGTEILANGQRALAFISRERLKIQKKSDYHFQLYQENKILIDPLPVATPLSQSRLKTEKTSEIVSEIIVN